MAEWLGEMLMKPYFVALPGTRPPSRMLGPVWLPTLSSALLDWIVPRRVVEDQEPIALWTLRGGGKLADAGVGALAGVAPRAVTRVIPAGHDLLAGELAHLDADRLPRRQVGEGEAAVLSPRRPNMIGIFGRLRRQQRLV